MSLFLGVVAPWLVAMFCYQASVLVSCKALSCCCASSVFLSKTVPFRAVQVAICNWAAILCQGFVNLAIPFMVYRNAGLLEPQAGGGGGALGPTASDECDGQAAA
eukprot:COSAG06_NODE_19795_length_822_cov_1.170124_2_plen_104_part_01